MDLLQPVIRPTLGLAGTAIAELQGRPVPAPGPEAELWMGAHPSAPSGVDGRPAPPWTRSSRPIRTASSGRDCAARFGDRLPFLLKVLSADQALSIQVHPSRAQAQAGFARRERARPVPRRPGPELRRRLAQARAAVRADPVRGAGRPARPRPTRRPSCAPWPCPACPAGGRPRRRDRPRAPWPRAGRRSWTWPDPGELVAAVVGRLPRLARRWRGRGPYAAACAAAVRVAADHPGDLGRGRHAADAARGAGAGPGGVHAGRRAARLPARHRRSSCSPTPTTWSGPG